MVKMLKKKTTQKTRCNILVADDQPEMLDVLTRALEKTYYSPQKNGKSNLEVKIFTAKNEEETLKKIIEGEEVMDIAIIDQHMPEKNGIRIINQAIDKGFFSDYILISGESLNREKLKSTGVIDYFEKPISNIKLIQKINKIMKNKQRYHTLYRENTLTRLYNMLNEKRLFSQSHVDELLKYIDDVSTRLGMKTDEVYKAKRAGIFHDVGKLGTREDILNKPVEELTKEEKEIARMHVQRGAKLLRMANCYEEADIVYQHHEKWDGTGYPQQLKGEEIRIEARLISVIEGYSGSKFNKPYQKALTNTQAYVKMIQNARDEKKDPYITQIFNDVLLDKGVITKKMYKRI